MLNTFKQIKTSLCLLVLLTILTGLIYPSIVTVVAQLLFPWQANGSFIEQNEKIIGSLLIGQSFTDSRYFWGRPSTTIPFPYNAENSSGSNMGALNPDFVALLENRVSSLRRLDPENRALVPVDLVTASASGLDPEISPLAALYQVHRIAKARGISEEVIQTLIQHSIKKRSFFILGEPRVNVLELNIALDTLKNSKEL